MSTALLPTLNPVAYIRTYVPVIVGSFVAWLVSRFPFVQDVFAGVETNLGPNVGDLFVLLLTAAVIALYYFLARKIGRRFPAVEKYLLGSSAQPVYVAPLENDGSYRVTNAPVAPPSYAPSGNAGDSGASRE